MQVWMLKFYNEHVFILGAMLNRTSMKTIEFYDNLIKLTNNGYYAKIKNEWRTNTRFPFKNNAFRQFSYAPPS